MAAGPTAGYGFRNHLGGRGDYVVQLQFLRWNLSVGRVGARYGRELLRNNLPGRGQQLWTVFKITPAGTLTTLHSFSSTDGASPNATLVQATNGNFYGTTDNGGTNNYGTVFKITPTAR